MSKKVELTKPSYGWAHLKFEVGGTSPLDIPLTYTQDITGLFLGVFVPYIKGKYPTREFVLAVDSKDTDYLIIAKKERIYIIDEQVRLLYVCKERADTLIRECMTSFVNHMDDWANFDIVDEAGDTNYEEDFNNRKAYIQAVYEELSPYGLRTWND